MKKEWTQLKTEQSMGFRKPTYLKRKIKKKCIQI